MGCVVLLGLAATAYPVAAQGPAILRVHPSVRSAGLNGAGAALVGNAGAVFSNPAGLATIRHVALEGAFHTTPGDGRVTTAALGWRVRQFDWGFGVQYFDVGTAAPGDASEWLAVGSLVYRFGLIAIGASGKYVGQELAGVSDRAISADIGLAIAIFDIMALGFTLQNVGGNWRSRSSMGLPRLTSTGFTMNYVDPQGTFRLLSTIERQWREGGGGGWILGAESGVVVRGVGVIGRAAYTSRTQPPDRSDITYGATLELGSVDIDYAYEPADLVGGGTQRIGMRISI